MTSVWIMGLAGTLLGFLGSVPPAGPGSALVIRWSTSGRRAAAVAAGLGCAVGEAAYALAGISGLSLLLESHPRVLSVLAAAGTLALCAVALRCLLARVSPAARPTPPPTGGAAVAASAHERRCAGIGALLAGLATALVNPLPLLSWSAAFAAIVALRGDPAVAADRVAFAVGAMSGVFAWLTVLGLAVSRLSRRLGPRFDVWVLRGTGLLLLGAAAGAAARGLAG